MKQLSLILTSATAASLLAPANSLLSQTAASGEIVVSATRIGTPIEQIGSSVSVISDTDIRNLNAQDLQAAVRLTPGLQFAINGGPGTTSSVFIRGAESDHTLVLINGIRVNSNTTGSFDFSSLPTHMIENVEVLRGPQGGLYGSDALGGVVSIATRKGVEGPLTGSVEAEYGEMGYGRADASVSGGNEDFDFSASVSHLELKDFDIAEDNGGVEDDPYERTSAYLGLGFNFAEDGRVDFTTIYTEEENELDGFRGADNTTDNSDQERIFTALSVEKSMSDIWMQSVSVGYNEQEYTGFNFSPVDFTTTSFDFAAKADFFLSDGYTLSAGYDFRRSEAENVGNFEEQDRDQNALFVQNQWSWDEQLFVTGSVRHDDYSDLSGETTWKLQASYQVADSTRFFGSVGTGFRAPTMNDLYFTFGGPARTYLRPEQSESFDVGFEQYFAEDTFVLNVTYFHSDIEDLIEWAPNSMGIWQPTNIAEANISGFETSLTYSPVDELSLRVFYTNLDAKDGATGNQLARRAEHSGGGSVDWQYSEQGSVHISVSYTGDRFDDGGNFTELEDFYLVTFGARYDVTENATLTFNVSNAFDEDYQTANGYATPDRIASVGAEFSF